MGVDDNQLMVASDATHAQLSSDGCEGGGGGVVSTAWEPRTQEKGRSSFVVAAVPSRTFGHTLD